MIRQIGSNEVLDGVNGGETRVDEIARKRGRRTDGKRVPRKALPPYIIIIMNILYEFFPGEKMKFSLKYILIYNGSVFYF